MSHRFSLAFGFACLLLGHSLSAQDRPDFKGTYEFESRSTRGDPFNGTVHIYGEPGRVRGFIYTTIDPPIPIDGARWLGTDTLGVRFRLGPTVVTQIFALTGDRITGHYSFTRGGEESTVPLSGRRLPRTARPDLVPTPCEVRGVRGTVRCAMLHVPEDPDAPTGRHIPLRIVILPALEDRESDAMFVFAGGPGQAATEIAGGYAQTMAGIRRHRDIVIVDQRGTGASNPLRCDFEDPNERAQLLFTWRFEPEALTGCRDALSKHADLRLYHSWIAASDIERVREWLKYPRINLYGGSYGTRMAQTYLARYPERTRTVTLRGVIAPDAALPRGAARNAQTSIDMIFEECKADPACLAAFPELSDQLRGLVRLLEQAPAQVRVRDRMTGDSVDISITRSVFAGSLRRVLMNGNTVRDAPLLIHRASQGDFSLLAPGIEGTLAVSRSLYIGMSLSVGCAEDAPSMAGADIEGLTRGSFMGDGPARGFLAACERWPQGAVPAIFHQPVTADVPVLVLSGRYDPATPASAGQRVADALPNALHVVVPGISHSPFPECTQGIMTQVVEDGGLTGVSLDCVRQMKPRPFGLPE